MSRPWVRGVARPLIPSSSPFTIVGGAHHVKCVARGGDQRSRTRAYPLDPRCRAVAAPFRPQRSRARVVAGHFKPFRGGGRMQQARSRTRRASRSHRSRRFAENAPVACAGCVAVAAASLARRRSRRVARQRSRRRRTIRPSCAGCTPTTREALTSARHCQREGPELGRHEALRQLLDALGRRAYPAKAAPRINGKRFRGASFSANSCSCSCSDSQSSSCSIHSATRLITWPTGLMAFDPLEAGARRARAVVHRDPRPDAVPR